VSLPGPARRMLLLAACGTALTVAALAGCGSSGSSGSSSSTAAPSVSSLRACLQKAGFKQLSSANPGQVTVSIPPHGSATISLEGSPQKAQQQLASANRGAASFGGGLGKNLVVGSALIAGVEGVSSAQLDKIKSCAASA
jgi:hypothetical protein